MSTGKWYLRFYKTSGLHIGGTDLKAQYNETILDAFQVFQVSKGQIRMDLVELDTGRVARHDYKKPLPEWLKEPLLREVAASTGKCP